MAKHTKKNRPPISAEFSFSSDEDKLLSNVFSEQSVASKPVRNIKRKANLKRCLDDLSFSGDEPAVYTDKGVSENEALQLGDLLSSVARKSSKTTRKIATHVSNGSSVFDSTSSSKGDSSTNLGDQLGDILQKAMHKKKKKIKSGKTESVGKSEDSMSSNDHSSIVSFKSNEETSVLADQLQQLLLSKQKPKKKQTKVKPRAESRLSPSSTALQTFIMDSDTDQENHDPHDKDFFVQDSSFSDDEKKESNCYNNDVVLVEESDMENSPVKCKQLTDENSRADQLSMVKHSIQVTSDKMANISIQTSFNDSNDRSPSSENNVSLQASFDSPVEESTDNALKKNPGSDTKLKTVGERQHSVSLQASFGSDSDDTTTIDEQSSHSPEKKDACSNSVTVLTTIEEGKHNISLQASFESDGRDDSTYCHDQAVQSPKNRKDCSTSATELTTREESTHSLSLQASFESDEDIAPIDEQVIQSPKDNKDTCSTSATKLTLTGESKNSISLQASFESDDGDDATHIDEQSAPSPDNRRETCSKSVTELICADEGKHSISLQASFESDDRDDTPPTDETQITSPKNRKETCTTSDTELTSHSISLQASFDSDDKDNAIDEHAIKSNKNRKQISSTSESSKSFDDHDTDQPCSDSEQLQDNALQVSVDASRRGRMETGAMAQGHNVSVSYRRTRLISLSDDSDIETETNISRTKRAVKPAKSNCDNRPKSRKLSESESDGSDFENFLSRVKKPANQFLVSPDRSMDSANGDSVSEFIVPDDEVSSEEDQAFYLKDRKIRERVGKQQYTDDESGSEYNSSSEESEEASEYSPTSSDSSEFEMESPQKPPNPKALEPIAKSIRVTASDKNKARKSPKETDYSIPLLDVSDSSFELPDPKSIRKAQGNDNSSFELTVRTTHHKDDDSLELPDPKSTRKAHRKDDSSFELPDPKSVRKAHRKADSSRLQSEQAIASSSAIKIDSDEDTCDASVFKTPANLLVKHRVLDTTTPNQKPPVRRCLTTPGRRPLILLQDAEERPSWAQDSATKPASFLQCLSDELSGAKRHPEAARFVTSFKKLKEELTLKLYQMYNESVFDGKLPANLELTWNVRLTKTAGYFSHRKRPTNGDYVIGSRIELSVKVCDRAERLRDTLIHEMCHAAVWILHGVREAHGQYWRHFARKANRVFPELALVERCHDYKIECKYTYRCTSCGYVIGRHSKSLDTEAKVCGYCRAPFQLIVNSKRGSSSNNSVASVPSTPRTPSRFALFVKENYGSLKKQASTRSHKEIMQQLSQDFAAKNKLS